MTASLTFNEIEKTEKSLPAKMVSMVVDNEYLKEVAKMISFINSSIDILSDNARYKAYKFIEVADIKQIKTTLSTYTNDDEKVNAFKEELLEDLTNFEKQIKTNHVQKIEELKKEKQFNERQLKVLDFAKHKLIMERLSRVEWPYDAKTKEFDTKIAALQVNIKRLEQKIEEAVKYRPLAKEKEILMYQMQLKEKYSVR
jgi:hypothetical protein